MKLCPNCSRTLDDNAQFCNFCGTTLAGVPSSPTSGYAPQQFSVPEQTSGKDVKLL